MSVNNLFAIDGSLWSIRALDISGNYGQKIDLSSNNAINFQTQDVSRAIFNNLGLVLQSGGNRITTQQNTNLNLDASNSFISFRRNNIEYAFMDTSFNFTNLPFCSQVPSNINQLVNKNYVDTLKYPVIVSSPTSGYTFINTNIATNVLVDITSVTATIVSAGLYRITGNLAVQNFNVNLITYGSIWCSNTASASVPAPGPSRNAAMIDINYNQFLPPFSQFTHTHMHGVVIATGAQLGGTGTRTYYLITQMQYNCVVAETPDGNGTLPVCLLIERIA